MPIYQPYCLQDSLDEQHLVVIIDLKSVWSYHSWRVVEQVLFWPRAKYQISIWGAFRMLVLDSAFPVSIRGRRAVERCQHFWKQIASWEFVTYLAHRRWFPYWSRHFVDDTFIYVSHEDTRGNPVTAYPNLQVLFTVISAHVLFNLVS